MWRTDSVSGCEVRTCLLEETQPIISPVHGPYPSLAEALPDVLKMLSNQKPPRRLQQR